MHSKIYNIDRPSISPSRSSKVKDNISFTSIYDDKMRESSSTLQYTNKGSSQDLDVAKLQSKILQMQKKIDEQKYQIEVLTRQTQQYINLCDQQKKQLNNMNIDMLKQEYNEQITQLIQQKDKITEMIYHLSQQYKIVQDQHQQQLKLMKARNLELVRLIDESLNKKQLILQEITICDQKHRDNQVVIGQQEERLDQLRNIERKLIIALKEIENLENKE